MTAPVPSAERRTEIDELWDRFEGGTDLTERYDRPTVFMALEDFWSFISSLDAQSADRARAEVEAMRERCARMCEADVDENCTCNPCVYGREFARGIRSLSIEGTKP